LSTLKNPKPIEAVTQIERFKEAARQLGCDEDEAAFDEGLRRFAKPKPFSSRAQAETAKNPAKPTK